MNWIRFLLAALASFVIQNVVGAVWHSILFKDLYTQEMTKVARPEVFMPALVIALAARSLLFAFIYPFGYSGGPPWIEGARFGALMGLISGVTGGIYFGVMNLGAGWFWGDLGYFVVEGVLAGMAIAAIYGKTPRAKGVRKGR